MVRLVGAAGAGLGWHVLLARAACYAAHRDNYSTLFNIATMQPLIDGPPFVQALEELVAVAGPSDPANSSTIRPPCGPCSGKADVDWH